MMPNTENSHIKPLVVRLLAATALLSPALPVHAQTAAPSAREAELESRLEQLEAAVRDLRAQLQAERAADAAQAQQQAQQAEEQTARIAAVEARPQAPQEGFRTASGSIRIGGYFKTVASFSRFDDGVVAANALARDFYLPGGIPVGGTGEGTVNDFSAKQSRFWLNATSDVAGHRLNGYLEVDFQTSAGTQGTERTSNGYNLALRRAFVQFDEFTIGQDWSTFQYTGALPESTDFVGPTEGTVFVRQPLVRYSRALGGGTTLHVSLENAETASAVPGSPTLTENDDDQMPDIAARLHHAGGFGELSLAVAGRQLRTATVTGDDTAFAWGVSMGGNVLLSGASGPDLRFMATYGQGMGRYVGLNFAPDAIVAPATGRMHRVNNMAALAALRVPLGGTWRSTLMGGWQRVDFPDGFAPGSFDSFNKQAWSIAANSFFSPMRGLDLGVELRHGVRELVDGRQGELNRLEFAAKYSF